MTAILGLSAFFHDSAACLVVDGRVVAAAQEERFSRIKNDAAFPRQAIAYCLAAAGLEIGDLSYVAFYDKPLVKFERLLETYVSYAPRGLSSFSAAMPPWLGGKLLLRRWLARELGPALRAPIAFLDHHESHAASAFFPSPFEHAAILTVDGVGEWSTAAIGAGRGNRIELTEEIRFPHSLGLLYSAFTSYCGFAVNSGEYKLMGLAPYGVPRYEDLIRRHLIDLRPDGSIWMDMSYFQYCDGLRMTNGRFHDLFGGPPRDPAAPITQRHMDIGASIQRVTEECVLAMARHAHARTAAPNLVMAGGVALNCVANGRLLREGPFERIWVQPAAGDAGGALGAALFVWHQLLEHGREPLRGDSQHRSYLGPAYPAAEVEAMLARRGAVRRQARDEADLLDTVAGWLDEGRTVGWCHGRAEFGPRALGARSILADPRRTDTQALLNLKIKFREGFRPFAPSVLREHAADWFELDPKTDSPYMLMVAPVREARRVPLTAEQARTLREDPDLITRVNIPRSAVPAVTHVDYSARIQTVDADNGRFHRLLQRFHARTGCPMLVNTSFNLSWEPIVLTPEDALNTFLTSEMDALVLEDALLLKSEQPAGLVEAQRRRSKPVPAPRTRGWRAWLRGPRGSDLEPVVAWQDGPDLSDRTVRQFAFIGAALVAAGSLWRTGGVVARIPLVVVVAVVAVGQWWPAGIRPVYVAALAVTRPIGAVMSRVVLAAIYYACLTPLALVFRLAGRDVLRRHARPQGSAWVARRVHREAIESFGSRKGARNRRCRISNRSLASTGSPATSGPCCAVSGSGG